MKVINEIKLNVEKYLELRWPIKSKYISQIGSTAANYTSLSAAATQKEMVSIYKLVFQKIESQKNNSAALLSFDELHKGDACFFLKDLLSEEGFTVTNIDSGVQITWEKAVAGRDSELIASAKHEEFTPDIAESYQYVLDILKKHFSPFLALPIPNSPLMSHDREKIVLALRNNGFDASRSYNHVEYLNVDYRRSRGENDAAKLRHQYEKKIQV